MQAMLEEGVYQTPEQAQAQGAKRTPLLIIQRKFGRQEPVMYHVTDQPPPVKSYDWARVAAIFVTGASWQFSSYPYKVGSQRGLALHLRGPLLTAQMWSRGE